MEQSQKKTLTPKEVAEVCEVSRATVYEWLRTGKLDCVQLHGYGGRYQISKDAVDRIRTKPAG